MPEHKDFRYLCDAAGEKGYHIGLTVTTTGATNSQGEIVRRELRSIRVENKEGAVITAAKVEGKSLDIAARRALELLREATA